MGRGGAVLVGQFMNGYPRWSVDFNPIEQFITPCFKRLHVHGFLVGHDVACDVDFNALG